jgi:hypothetical protein
LAQPAAGSKDQASPRAHHLPPLAPGGFGDIVDGGGGSNTSPIASFQGNGITTSDDLWWFNGVTPANYSTQVTLTASSGVSSDYYSWIITSGGGTVVQFSDGSLSTGGTGMNTVQLVSIGASAAAQTLTFDVSIWLGINGNDSGTAEMAVPRPDHLDYTGRTDGASAKWGYYTYIYYDVKDQFNRLLPRKVEVNEQWTSGLTNDFTTTNWLRPPETWNTVNPDNFYDYITGPQTGVGAIPEPWNPQTPFSAQKIQHWGQAFYVGSLQTGKGQKVQTDTLYRYRDHGAHESVVSPP